MTSLSIRRLLAALLLMAAPGASFGQTEWLPTDLMEAMADDLAQRLRAVDPEGVVVASDGVPMARAGIAGTVSRIEALGTDGIIAMAPALPDLELPPADDRYIDAMVHWGMCVFPAQAAVGDSSEGEGALERRITAAAMITTIALVNTYLRHEYLKAGVTDEEVREFYSRPELAAVIRELRASGPLVLDTMERCLGPLDELMN